MAVVAIILTILAGVFLAQGRFFALQDALAEVQLNAFRALDATGIYAGSGGEVIASQTINGTAYATGPSLVVLKIPSINSGGAIIGNVYDHVAIGRDPGDAGRFITDLAAGAGSARPPGKHIHASFVDKVIFRYNSVSETSATALDLYVKTSKITRGQTVTAPLGKAYYLGDL
jgi:hypothetical protein